jgi:hypothetical protein
MEMFSNSVPAENPGSQLFGGFERINEYSTLSANLRL